MIRELRNMVVVAVVLSFSVGAASVAEAAKGGKGKGGGGDDGGGTACTDTFPSFIYTKEGGKRKSPHDSLYVSSSEGCRSVKLIDIDDLRLPGPRFSFEPSSGGGSGVVAWLSGDYRDLYALRFSVDADGNVAHQGAELVLNADTTIAERFWSLDVEGTVAAVYSRTDSIAEDYEYSVRLVDLQACSGDGPCDSWDLVRSTRTASIDCIDDHVSSGLDVWDCLVVSGIRFDTTGTHLFYSFATPGTSTAGNWEGIARIDLSATDLAPELVSIGGDGEEGLPLGKATDLDGRRVLATHACIGFSGGTRDCRLYFLDVDACAAQGEQLSDWQQCQTTAYSGQAPGFGPSWRIGISGNLEVLYFGWGNQHGSLRVLDPQANPLNDRQVISDGWYPDSGF